MKCSTFNQITIRELLCPRPENTVENEQKECKRLRTGMIATRQWLLDWTGLLYTMTPNNMATYTRPTDTIPEGMPIQMEENFNPTHR